MKRAQREYNISPDARHEVLSVMRFDSGMSATEIGKAVGKTTRLMLVHLNRLYDAREVGYQLSEGRTSLNKRYKTRMWFRVSDDYVRPLNAPQDRCDTRALADCFGGYTYLAQTSRERNHGQLE